VPERDLPDAVQDVFVVAHAKLSDFEARSRIETWLYGICLRLASDRRRSAASRLEVYGHETERVSDARAPTEATERREGLELLERILSALPLEQRAVFVLFEIDALSCDAIAELLEIPLGTVYSRLRLARSGFRKKLDQLHARERFQLSGGAGP
jgi:RNA polymerase sigma-70 factor (ECF subfamily)